MEDLQKQIREPTKEQIAEYKEAFSLFDKDGDNVIDIKYLGLLVRSLNRNPTESELEQMSQEVDPLGHEKVELPDFLTMMASRPEENDPEEELYEAFKTFAKDKKPEPTMRGNVLKYIVTSGREPLTDEEAEDMLIELGVENTTEFKISDFIRLIVSNMNNY
ncbi:hypothetical protein IMG5_144690 [Ichthyophthirius multifiliis]|uniref:Calmodulin n=1 Tax=Ichthyophthirius multifiliis TaxID=5932 RepID=G0QXQ8_ICHMU|nr:hypothetical protein IMG5_144690 [Ichthyophthirius multifiliis]EGR29995.1 hypothetical protein IMG5_144690 [Ichthyophthirius multifiliis]|eukprot:XP_004031231.1 hypothetical protein IMG5_144690 [Ichthyophthirius multifiliis]